MITLKEAVNKTTAKFSFAKEGVLYYNVTVENETYQFPIDLNNKEDVGSGIFLPEDKTIFFMRWIRKAMDKGEFVKIK